jgi:hydroxyacylglutathione hydrolase
LPYIEQFLDERGSCVSHFVSCPSKGKCVVIDPSTNVKQYIDRASKDFAEITQIIDTHIHADHISGAKELSKLCGAPIFMHESTRVDFPIERLKDGDIIESGNIRLKVIHTPGHTKESISLVFSDIKRDGRPWSVFTGDTLFVGDIGRLDFSDAGTPEEMHDSLFSKLLSLEDYIEIYPAHYVGSVCGTGMSLKTVSTIGFERRFNIALRNQSIEDFRKYLNENLPKPFPEHLKIKKMNSTSGN